MNPEQELTRAAFIKLQLGEPMSTHDLNRIKNTLGTIPLQIDIPDQGQLMGLMGSFRAMLQERFLTNK